MKPITAHKGSSVGEAVFRAANNGRSQITAGLEFEYNGTKYRVVEPSHAGLRSYFSYLPVDLPPVPPGLKLIFAGSIADLLSKPLEPPQAGQPIPIPPYLRDILAALRPDPAPEPETEGCPCGCGDADPDFEEVPGAEEPKEAAPDIRVTAVQRGVDIFGPCCKIFVRGTTATYKGEAAAVVAAVASHFGVDAPDDGLRAKVAHLEAENKRLAGLYDHYRDDAQKARARAEKLEGIIHRFFIDAQDAYKDAEIIPF